MISATSDRTFCEVSGFHSWSFVSSLSAMASMTFASCACGLTPSISSSAALPNHGPPALCPDDDAAFAFDPDGYRLEAVFKREANETV